MFLSEYILLKTDIILRQKVKDAKYIIDHAQQPINHN